MSNLFFIDNPSKNPYCLIMKIEMMNGETIDTDQLSDIKAMIVEGLESSSKEFCDQIKKIDGVYYLWAGSKTVQFSWTKVHIIDGVSFNAFIGNINQLVKSVTGGKKKIIVVDNT